MHPDLAREQAARRGRWMAARNALATAERIVEVRVADVATQAALAFDGETVMVTDELLVAEASLAEAQLAADRLRHATSGWSRGAGLLHVA